VSAGRVVASHEMGELATMGATSLVAWRIRARDPLALGAALAELGVPTGNGNGNGSGIDGSGIGNGNAGGSPPAPDTGGGVELPPMTEEQAADLLTELVGRGVKVVAFAPVGTALESAYLALTEERR
jgi:ABC-2 type transport system ATP-binding protein